MKDFGRQQSTFCTNPTLYFLTGATRKWNIRRNRGKEQCGRAPGPPFHSSLQRCGTAPLRQELGFRNQNTPSLLLQWETGQTRIPPKLVPSYLSVTLLCFLFPQNLCKDHPDLFNLGEAQPPFLSGSFVFFSPKPLSSLKHPHVAATPTICWAGLRRLSQLCSRLWAISSLILPFPHLCLSCWQRHPKIQKSIWSLVLHHSGWISLDKGIFL